MADKYNIFDLLATAPKPQQRPLSPLVLGAPPETNPFSPDDVVSRVQAAMNPPQQPSIDLTGDNRLDAPLPEVSSAINLRPMEPLPVNPQTEAMVRGQGTETNQPLNLTLPEPTADVDSRPVEAVPSRADWNYDKELDRNTIFHNMRDIINKGSGPDGSGKADVKGRIKDAILRGLISAGHNADQNGGVATWGTLGAGIGGTAAGALDPAWNERAKHEIDLTRSDERLAQLDQQRKAERDLAIKDAQVINLQDQPGLRYGELKRKIDKDTADREYKKNLALLGKEKADNVRAYRDAIIDLKQQGLDQGDDRIKQLEKRIDEEVRHNKATEGLTGQRIAQTGANTVANNQTRMGVEVLKNKQDIGKTRMLIQSMTPAKGESQEAFTQRQQKALQALADRESQLPK